MFFVSQNVLHFIQTKRNMKIWGQSVPKSTPWKIENKLRLLGTQKKSPDV